jgi:hypothetical protein
MSYKDLLVVLDSETASRGRMDLAAALAARFAAHLVGLYLLPIPETPRHLGYYDPAMLEPFFRELREKAPEVCAKEREAFEHAAPDVTALRATSGTIGTQPLHRSPEGCQFSTRRIRIRDRPYSRTSPRRPPSATVVALEEHPISAENPRSSDRNRKPSSTREGRISPTDRLRLCRWLRRLSRR